MKWKDIGIRMLKTFIQGFLGALISYDFTQLSLSKSILIGALSGGICAVMNLIINMLNTDERSC